jgi:hypothetical protein
MQNVQGMPSPVSGNLRYHAQDDTTYCGAAVEQMILRSYKGLLDQDFLAERNRVHNPAEQVTGVSVGALALTLDEQVPGAFTYGQPADPLGDAAAELIRTKSGVAALVNGGTHWVALNGVVTAPGDSRHSGFYVHDPHAMTLPTFHSDRDPCGTGRTFGIANQFFTFAGMRRWYAPSALVYKIEPRAPATARKPSPPGFTRPAAGVGAFDPLSATASAIAALGIAHSGPLSAILAGFRATAFAAVGDLYHVTLQRESQVIGYALLARADGALLAVMVSGNESPLMNLSNDSVRTDLDRNKEQIARIAPEFSYQLAHTRQTVEASYFWRPCREAPSPGHPLVRLSYGPNVLYRDHFGTFHAQLHLLQS